MIFINAGDKQPLDCPKCKEKYGYQISNRIQKYVDIMYTEEGEHNGCVYSGFEKILYTIKRPYCCNCRTTLSFKVKC